MRISLLSMVVVLFLLPSGSTGQSGNCSGCELVGFSESANINRESELRQNCGAFRRVSSNAQYSFSSLCRSIGKRCARVCDWQGATKGCDDASQFDANRSAIRDGSRVALCVPDSPPAQSDVCTDRLDRKVPLGSTQCISHDVYVCTVNAVWKKTGGTCN